MASRQKTVSLHVNFFALNANADINPLNAELNPICHLLALLGAHHIFHVSRIKIKENVEKKQSTT
jgi:hypothetical protein